MWLHSTCMSPLIILVCISATVLSPFNWYFEFPTFTNIHISNTVISQLTQIQSHGFCFLRVIYCLWIFNNQILLNSFKIKQIAEAKVYLLRPFFVEYRFFILMTMRSIKTWITASWAHFSSCHKVYLWKQSLKYLLITADVDLKTNINKCLLMLNIR